jgi:hypothetical protein
MTETGEKKPAGFTAKAVTITVAALIVLFFVKLWIVDGLRAVSPQEYRHPAAFAAQEDPQKWDKTKHVMEWKDAAKYLGKYVETEGVIVASHKTEKICYLNFDNNYRDYVALVIFADNFKRFPDNPEKYYLNKKVKVEGRIKDYKGRLEIVLGSQEQIKIVQ